MATGTALYCILYCAVLYCIYTVLYRTVLYREATLLLYLSSVRGGLTAFPSLGLALQPSVGSAVFWHNLDR